MTASEQIHGSWNHPISTCTYLTAVVNTDISKKPHSSPNICLAKLSLWRPHPVAAPDHQSQASDVNSQEGSAQTQHDRAMGSASAPGDWVRAKPSDISITSNCKTITSVAQAHLQMANGYLELTQI